MSEAADHLITTFDALPIAEQHEVLVELLRRGGELPDSILTDNHLVGIADELFQALDAEEANGDTADER